MSLRLAGAHRSRLHLVAIAAVFAIAVTCVTFAGSGIERASAATPTISCSTNPDIFNTAYNGAGGVAGDGTADLIWSAAHAPAQTTVFPPAGTVWTPARVGNLAGGGWGGATATSNWISLEGPGGPAATQGSAYYYGTTVNFDPSIDPSKFAVNMTLGADDGIMQVWVNGVAQSQFPNAAPGGFFSGMSIELDHSWQAGANVIVVETIQGAGLEGFLAHNNGSQLCTTQGAQLTRLSVVDGDTNGDGVVGDAGDQLTFSYRITNLGSGAGHNAYAYAPTITSSLCGTITGFTLAMLPPGGTSDTSTGCVHTITAAEAAAGKVVDTATAKLTSYTGDVVYSSAGNTSSYVVKAAPARTLSLAITPNATDVDRDGIIDAGDTVGLSYKITNTGSQALKTVTLVSGLSSSTIAVQAALAVGASVTATATHTVTAAEGQAGKVVETATAKAITTTSDGITVSSSPVSSTTSAGVLASISAGDCTAESGKPSEVVQVSCDVKNNGAQPLRNVSFADSPELEHIHALSSLEAGESDTVTATYTIPFGPAPRRDELEELLSGTPTLPDGGSFSTAGVTITIDVDEPTAFHDWFAHHAAWGLVRADW